MPYTLDTNIIKIRDVFAMNSKTGAFIDYDSFPVIGDKGHLTWKTPLELLGSISYLSTTVIELLESIQPGLSTLSTNFTKDFNSMLVSTVNGLRETYVRSSDLFRKITDLTIECGYMSTTSFYSCVERLSYLYSITENVSPMIIFLQANGSNLSGAGYVSTINPGSFHNYYSTLGFTGGLNNTVIGGTGIESLSLDLGGFQFLACSKMRIDINANVSVNYTNPPQPQSVVTSFSTFLYKNGPIGTPVVVNYSNLNFTMSRFTYFLTAADLSTGPFIVGLRHRITNFDNTNATINVQPINISARLINMD